LANAGEGDLSGVDGSGVDGVFSGDGSGVDGVSLGLGDAATTLTTIFWPDSQ